MSKRLARGVVKARNKAREVRRHVRHECAQGTKARKHVKHEAREARNLANSNKISSLTSLLVSSRSKSLHLYPKDFEML